MKCKFCGFESDELQWDKANHEITGKWRLIHTGQGRPHECQREPEQIPEKTVVCPRGLCGKKMKQSKLQEHIKKEHIDFQGEW